jgi:hypothetical protein
MMADTPKLWRDMTPEEKGALLLGWQQGKEIEVYLDNEYWLATEIDPHRWDRDAYRIKPEPKRETVTAKLCIDAHCTSLHMRPDYYRGQYGNDNFYFTLTFDTIDGKPDPESIKIEEL